MSLVRSRGLAGSLPSSCKYLPVTISESAALVSAFSKCRAGGNASLVQVLDLGEQAMTGIFPRSPGQTVATGPLQLVKCLGDKADACGLVQLAHDFDLDTMYGEN